MEAPINKDERIELRISTADKRMFKRAQELSGDKSFSSFIARIVKEQAEKIVAQYDQILASEKDRAAFFEAVFHPAAPNSNLVAAAQRYRNKSA
jgi:uncharacterized protein (DUF1778 family)